MDVHLSSSANRPSRSAQILAGSSVKWAKRGVWCQTVRRSFTLTPTRSVLAQIDAKIVKPPPERPFEGVITIHLEISPMASSEYEPGRWVCERRVRIACCTDVRWDHTT